MLEKTAAYQETISRSKGGLVSLYTEEYNYLRIDLIEVIKESITHGLIKFNSGGVEDKNKDALIANMMIGLTLLWKRVFAREYYTRIIQFFWFDQGVDLLGIRIGRNFDCLVLMEEIFELFEEVKKDMEKNYDI